MKVSEFYRNKILTPLKETWFYGNYVMVSFYGLEFYNNKIQIGKMMMNNFFNFRGAAQVGQQVNDILAKDDTDDSQKL